MGVIVILHAVIRAAVLVMVSTLGAARVVLLIGMYIWLYIPLLSLLLSAESSAVAQNVIADMSVEHIFFLSLYVNVLFMFLGEIKGVGIAIAYLNGARKIKDASRLQIQGILEELVCKAKQNGLLDSSFNANDITIMLDKSDGVNAYVYGKRVICVTQGLLLANIDVIRGVLAHELGHIIHPNANILRCTLSCNWCMYFCELPLRFGLGVCSLILRVPFKPLQLVVSILILPGIVVKFAGGVVGVFVDVIICYISRYYEYGADKIVYNLDEQNGLISFLSWTNVDSGNFFTELFDMHPLARKRIYMLHAMK